MTDSDDSDNPVKAAMARVKRVTPELRVVGGRAVGPKAQSKKDEGAPKDKPKRSRKRTPTPVPSPQGGERPEAQPEGEPEGDVTIFPPPDDDHAPPDGLTPDDLGRADACKDLDPNDRDNGRRLIIWFGADLLYVSGMGWLTWRGTHWQRDEGDLGARAKAQALVDKIKLEAALIKASPAQQRAIEAGRTAMKKGADDRSADDDRAIDRMAKILVAVAKRRGDRVKFAISSGNAGKTEAMLKQAASHQAIAAEDLDKDLHQFNLRSGTLAFRRVLNEESDPQEPRYNWVVLHGPHTRTDRITKLAEVDYDPEASCAEFLTFLERTQPDPIMRRFLQVFFGYALLIGGNDAQVLIYLYGTGANGKSIFLETIGRLAGSYRAVVSPDTLVGDQQRDGSKANSDIARLHSARFVSVEEMPRGTPIRENMVKSLTGGVRQVARFLQKENFEFDPVFTAALSGNDLPNLSGLDAGIKRRVLIAPWEVTIPEGERKPFGEVMKALEAERPGILNWLIEGAIAYLNDGLFAFVPEKVRAFTDAYWEERDNVGVFAEANMIREEGAKVTAGRLYTCYTQWCERNGLHKASQRSFGDRLRALGYKKKTGGVYVYLDVKLSEAVANVADIGQPDDPGDPGWQP